MNKLSRFITVIFLLVFAVYLMLLTTTLPPKEVAFVTFLAVASALVLVMLWRPVAVMMFPALVATLATLMAWAHLSGTSSVIQLMFPALITVVAIWTAVQLNLRLWKVLLGFIWLAGAIYFPLVGFQI